MSKNDILRSLENKFYNEMQQRGIKTVRCRLNENNLNNRSFKQYQLQYQPTPFIHNTSNIGFIKGLDDNISYLKDYIRRTDFIFNELSFFIEEPLDGLIYATMHLIGNTQSPHEIAIGFYPTSDFLRK